MKNRTEILAKRRAEFAPTKEANRLKREQYKLEHKEELERKKQEQIEHHREYARQYARTHKAQINETKRKYFKANEEKRKAHYKRCIEYQRRRRQEDPEYRERYNAYYREVQKKKRERS